MDAFATASELAMLTGTPDQEDLSREQFLLDLASSTIRAWCDQVLSVVVEDVFTAYPTASTFLSLPERPVTEVSFVVVNGLAKTDYYISPARTGIRSGTVSAPGAAWTEGATVTYSHGWAEDTEEYGTIKSICLSAATRAWSMNFANASVAMGNQLMETAGYGPEVFLTPGEKDSLMRFRRGLVRCSSG